MEIPDSIKSEILSYSTYDGNFSQAKSKNAREELLEFAHSRNITLEELFYLAKFGLPDFPVCLECGEPVRRFFKGSLFCSVKCANNSELIKKKMRDTMLDRYGVPYSSQRKSWKDIIQMKWTNISESELAERTEKSRETSRQRYGANNYSQTETGRSKIKERMRKDSNKLLRKRTETSFERYGVQNPMQTREIAKLSVMEHRKNYFPVFLKKLGLKKLEFLDQIDDFLGNMSLNYKCLVCGQTFSSPKRSVQRLYCPECAKYHLVSKLEHEIIDYIQEIYTGEIIRNSRKLISPYELDVYIPEHNLAIEFNGIYWHSEKFKQPDYHQKKFLKCWKRDIKLLQFFDFEWETRQELCKSYIKSALGEYNQTLKLSDLNQRIVNKTEINEFLRANSFEKENFEYGTGLFFKNELVFLVAHKGTIHRYCIKLGCEIKDYMDYLRAFPHDFPFSCDAMKFTNEPAKFKLIATEPPLCFVAQKHRVYDAGRMIVSCI